MISVHFEVGKNRLVLTIKGRPTVEHLHAALAQLKDGLPRLQPPFDVLSNVTELESLEQIPTHEATAALKCVFQAGVRKMVRIVGRCTTGAVHAERIARHGNYHANLAFSLDEAEQVFSSR